MNMADPARVLEDALTLPADDRARIARELIHSLDHATIKKSALAGSKSQRVCKLRFALREASLHCTRSGRFGVSMDDRAIPPDPFRSTTRAFARRSAARVTIRHA
jgi:hypothetical protein